MGVTGGDGGDGQQMARVIGFQKMYGLFGQNHHILEKVWDVTPVTENERTKDRNWKIVQYFGRTETAKNRKNNK